MLGAIIQVLLSGFIIGALARWAVPGPDPMSVPMTILLGVFGSLRGGGIAAGIFGAARQDSGSIFAILIGSIVASMLLLIGYRRFVQKRPITGPEAHRPPSDRARFATLLHAPGRQSGPSRDDVDDQLRKLSELRRDGVLTDEEVEAKKAELLARP